MNSLTTRDITQIIQDGVAEGVKAIYDHEVKSKSIPTNVTRKEFEGDYTVVVFPFTKAARKKPEQIGEDLGNYLVEHVETIESFNVVKGFLNLVVTDAYWTAFLQDILQNENYGQHAPNNERVMVEFSSPNTNKPLHLGHIRNILLGWSCSKILAAAGYDVIKTQIVNDRGIAVCKSMLAWHKFGNGETPTSTGIKGDHLVGKYYVKFDQALRAEYTEWQQTPEAKSIFDTKKKEGQDEATFFSAFKNNYFNEHSSLGKEAKEMLLKWEDGDKETKDLWSTMNGWVYGGFDETYKALGVDFDKLYYESGTYLLGRKTVEDGVEEGIFYRKPDNSIWIDLDASKLDHKLVLRSDGTSVYMTQDIGTAMMRYKDYKMDKMIHVVGDEQNYHFKVLFEIMKKLGVSYADGLYHLSYGMVDLPTGKMKSREGTVVDADDLIKEVKLEAAKSMQERSETTDLSDKEQEDINRKVGLAALKYFIVKVNPQKRMVFDPSESVDLQGQTGPYIQYSYVRINGVLNKAEKENIDLTLASNYKALEPAERELILQLREYPGLIAQAANSYDPSIIANYCYSLAKAYSRFWHDLSIFGADTPEAVAFRLQLSQMVGRVTKSGMDLLGIEMPHRM